MPCARPQHITRLFVRDQHFRYAALTRAESAGRIALRNASRGASRSLAVAFARDPPDAPLSGPCRVRQCRAGIANLRGSTCQVCDPGHSTSDGESHYRPRGIRAGYFCEACGGEHGLGPDVEGRRRHPGGLEPGRVDRMTLDGRRAMLAGELDGGLQESQSDPGSPVARMDGEACDPPDPVLSAVSTLESLVAGDAREGSAGSYPGPSDGMIIDVRDEPRWYHRVLDLLAQRVPVVWCRLFSRVFRCCGAEEKLTPAPRRLLTAPTEHRDQVTPPIRSRGADIDGHDFHHRARATLVEVTAGELRARPYPARYGQQSVAGAPRQMR
jgi:hypothetical protein